MTISLLIERLNHDRPGKSSYNGGDEGREEVWVPQLLIQFILFFVCYLL